MWCSQCHQDMPAVAHAATGRLVCSRCQRPMAGRKAANVTPICDDGIALDEPGAAAAAAPPIRTDDWSARQRSRELERKLRRPTSIGVTTASSTRHSSRRLDPPQNLFDQIEHVTTPAILTGAPPSTTATPLRSRRTVSGQVFAWLVVALGTIALIAGIGLIAWSLSVNQMIYWNLAIGLALGGQGALILGLVLVVSRLWRTSRFAACKLQEVHARLAQLQHTTDALTAMRSGGAPAFYYADLVRGASPQMLLSNLKGQLDQLATRVGNW
ncbi:MAG: hypothetical protein L0228_16975 [Planctomycetes bacterium]|nr:hypothetical protein [Planctomycetota bacterium]